MSTIEGLSMLLRGFSGGKNLNSPAWLMTLRLICIARSVLFLLVCLFFFSLWYWHSVFELLNCAKRARSRATLIETVVFLYNGIIKYSAQRDDDNSNSAPFISHRNFFFQKIFPHTWLTAWLAFHLITSLRICYCQLRCVTCYYFGNQPVYWVRRCFP